MDQSTARVAREQRCWASLWLLIMASLCPLFALAQTDGDVIFASGFEQPGDRLPSPAEAARFLTQATFGPTVESIAELQQLGYRPWLQQQYQLLGAPHRDYYFEVAHGYSGSDDRGRHEKWWQDVVEGRDQLRQRVAFALSEIFVVSDVGRPLTVSQIGMATYYDTLREHAFANYRELLEAVTLSPVMGTFLSMAGNEPYDPVNNIRPDENYAREVLQLFSIGIYELNIDGSFRRDTDGELIPTYDEETVKAFARVFTGWELPSARYWRQPTEDINSAEPLRSYPDYHDYSEKTVLGGALLPAGQTPEQDLTQALDAIFQHPNVGPFIARLLIQRLVTSNPSPQYIARVATVFNNNGAGERGDLRAVIEAILLDSEARQGHLTSVGFGKLREPVLRLSHLWRAFSIQPGNRNSHGEFNTASPGLSQLTSDTGQQPLSAPSVFNFFHPDFRPVGPIRNAGLVAPEFGIATDNNLLATSNRISRQILYYFAGNGTNATNSAYLDFQREIDLAADPAALLDHLDLLLLSGAMTDAMRAELTAHLNALGDDAAGRSQRARDAITLIVMSADYLVQM